MIPNLPIGFVTFCAAQWGCLTTTERAVCRCGKPVIGNEWHMCGSDVRRFGEEDIPRVSLPNKAEHEPVIAEEIQGAPPSGWRERPGML